MNSNFVPIYVMEQIKPAAKKAVLWMLEAMVAWRLGKIKPAIVGVTGSVGKTSTKEAIYAVLGGHRTQKSYNTEFGVMLAVLEQESGYSSPLKWLVAMTRAFFSTLFLEPPYYRTLIVEMGADKPRDIEYLVKHLPPQIGVLTAVKPVHLAEGQFKNVDEVLEEKSKLLAALPRDGWAIVNADDRRVMEVVPKLKCRVLSVGMSSKADLRAKEVESGLQGLKFTLSYEDRTHTLHFPHLLGEHQVYVILPAIAVGFLHGLSITDIMERLRDFRLPPGRMSVLEGVHGSIIIDSSYNASPETMAAALQVLAGIPVGMGRKIAALGSMNELGKGAEREHRKIGKMLPTVCDVLVTVGGEARWFAEEAMAHGLPRESVFSFDSSLEAGNFLRQNIAKRDVILAKGSQNRVRMEHCVKIILAHPEEAANLLPRQDEYWLRHP